MQLDHYSSKFKKQSFPIIIVTENVTNAPNIGSLFRTADAFGIQKLVLCGTDIPMGRKMTKTSRATENVVHFEILENPIQILSDLKAKHHQIIALEITSNSQSLSNFVFPKDQPIVLVIGDENFGISEAVLELCDHVVHVDMYGQNSSMNVVQATSITLYEITKQLN